MSSVTEAVTQHQPPLLPSFWDMPEVDVHDIEGLQFTVVDWVVCHGFLVLLSVVDVADYVVAQFLDKIQLHVWPEISGSGSIRHFAYLK